MSETSTTGGPSTRDRPRLPRGVRTRFDDTRGTWMLLAPERTLKLDAVGAAILAEVDGEKDVDQVIDALAIQFKAPRDQIARDVMAFLGALGDRRMLEMDPPADDPPGERVAEGTGVGP
ncbi:MAG: pyrroloquinoline quinone biosynthesis peptide chaperone PqqD [Rhodospirillum sp.]|nr:pyrroloquinoline quinone biosynthesis peptide chaperone PqqD [Rhodospirillum sp.]MCF8488897.1 pyrroloquinoline quinone biosynthesis peptide chaperone PqqD [Rhodospirillum sp.]MCF8500041.1 pyrroloquinoline quinone biosynthesis peptide chaperone PqqD [Rhodospirillum sp.]